MYVLSFYIDSFFYYGTLMRYMHSQKFPCTAQPGMFKSLFTVQVFVILPFKKKKKVFVILCKLVCMIGAVIRVSSTVERCLFSQACGCMRKL